MSSERFLRVYELAAGLDGVSLPAAGPAVWPSSMHQPPNHGKARCANCGQRLSGPFCAACGEKVVDDHDYTLRHFLEHALEAFTHADGKVFKTLRTLLAHPGSLTADYLAGRRRPYLAPLPLFLIVNTVFFLVMIRLDWNTVTTPLDVQMNRVWFRPVVRALVSRRLDASGESLAAYAGRFDHLTGALAHSCVILLVPLFSLPVWLLFHRCRRHYVEHLIFALHFCAFWLLYMLGTLGLVNSVLFYGLLRFGLRPSSQALDIVITLGGFAVFAVYLFHAVRRVYPGPGGLRAAQALLLTCSLALVLDSYRLLLFFVTFFST